MPIRMSENFRAVFYAPFYAAIALGHHAREGVDVELIASPAPGAAAPSLADGSIDVSWGGPMRVMKARDQDDRSLVAFCDVVRGDPFYLVGRREGGAPFSLTQLPDRRFASVSEVPTPWLCLQHDLREAGLDPSKLNRIADRNMGENLAALLQGTLDVAQMFEPYTAIALREGVGEILYAASTRGPTAYTTFLATRESVEKNRLAFAGLTRGMAATQAWIAAHTGAELATAVQSYYPDVTSTDLAASLTRYKASGIWATDTTVSRAGFDRLARSLQSGGFISRLPDYEDCVIVP
jgi:NitT/TauT family transport system substrate-binding protein